MKKRVYDDGCAVAHALDLVGERWALLVMRELLLGPKRFSDLRASLPGISANVLTQRLEDLEAVSIVRRRALPPPAASSVYELTEWGQDSEELFRVIGRWAARSPLHNPKSPLSVASVVMSMRTMFSRARAGRLTGSLGFRFGREEFVAVIGKGNFSIGRGEATGADVIVTGNQNALAGALYGSVPLKALEKSGALKVEGDHALFERYLTLFPLPEKAPQDAGQVPANRKAGRK
ncbi:MAG TPA: winged helix-turn-helix transcriptional regulator [Pseudolabrys sp.]|nr:winged helix-turn-helix transcriptional regulator [Pseudolabrys sp.]